MRYSPDPDPCAYGVPRAQCWLKCGLYCKVARRMRADAEPPPPTMADCPARIKYDPGL